MPNLKASTIMLPENPTLEQIREFFKGDRFATDAAGCIILEGSEGHALVEMPLDRERHYNAAGGVMGGAIFTLADYALAIACNINQSPTVSISNTIEFFSATKGDKLIAECTTDKSGRRVGFYTVTVKDNTDRLVAKMVATCAR